MSLAAALGGLLLLFAAAAAGWLTGVRRVHRARARSIATERQVRALTAENRTLRVQAEDEAALLERLPEPVILFGADRAISRLNEAARTTLGSAAPALLRRPAFRAALDRTLADGRPQSIALTLTTPGARELEVRITPVPGASKRAMALLSDRTRERAVEQMRADFVANASHELRTPLTSLIGFIDTLRGPAADDPAAQRRFLDIMDEQAQRMHRLISDLLDLSRIELLEHVAPAERVNVPELTEGIVAGLGPLLRAGNHRIELAMAPDLPEVAGDEDQLGQVLQNLLENAIKYGRDGGTVRVSGTASPRAGETGVSISVTDEGDGIPAHHLPRLTERFYRVNTRRSRAVGGTGLGLAIVKHIVNRHRGHLRIDSAEGVGTTVTIWMPSAREPGAADRVSVSVGKGD